MADAENADNKSNDKPVLVRILNGTEPSLIIVDNHNYKIKSDGNGEAVFLTDLTVSKNEKTSIAKDEKIDEYKSLVEIAISAEAVIKENKKSGSDSALVLFGEGEYENTSDFFINVYGKSCLDYNFSTGNLIGRITHKKTENNNETFTLKVSSRFGELFLKYIISEADGFHELPDSGSAEKSAGGYDWLLHYYWVTKLKRAYRLGLPKEYTSKCDRLTKVRGHIDPLDYAKKHKLGKYLCTYREHSYDNPAVALFAETYRKVRSGGTGFADSLHSLYQALLSAVNGVRRPRRELMQTKHFRNPYYGDYNLVIDISKQILRGESFDFAQDSSWSGFLFDVSMLFEYFVRKLIAREASQITVRSKSEHKYIPTGGTYNKDSRGEGQRELIPDLVFSRENGDLFIFDVKYKYFSTIYGVSREDLFQLHTYIGQWGNEQHEPDHGIQGCGFIYPIKADRLRLSEFAQEKNCETHSIELKPSETDRQRKNIRTPDDCIVYKGKITQQGLLIPFFVLFLTIPDDYLPILKAFKIAHDSAERSQMAIKIADVLLKKQDIPQNIIGDLFDCLSIYNSIIVSRESKKGSRASNIFKNALDYDNNKCIAKSLLTMSEDLSIKIYNDQVSISNKADLDRLIQWLRSKLNVYDEAIKKIQNILLGKADNDDYNLVANELFSSNTAERLFNDQMTANCRFFMHIFNGLFGGGKITQVNDGLSTPLDFVSMSSGWHRFTPSAAEQ